MKLTEAEWSVMEALWAGESFSLGELTRALYPEHVLKLKVIDLKTDPQLMGALGAAEYARQKGMARV